MNNNYTEKMKEEFKICLPLRLERKLEYHRISEITGLTLNRVNVVFQMYYRYGEDDKLKKKLAKISREIVTRNRKDVNPDRIKRKFLKSREKCTCCGKSVNNNEINIYPVSGKKLCRDCMYDGNPDPRIDVRSFLSPMANNGRWW